MTVAIRRARPEDAARIAELHVEGWQEFRSFVPRELMEARTVASRTAEWSEFLAVERANAWTTVAELEGAVVGFASTRLLREPDHGARGEIKNLFVDGAVRRAGVGKRLLADAARWLARARRRADRALLLHREPAPRGLRPPGWHRLRRAPDGLGRDRRA